MEYLGEFKPINLIDPLVSVCIPAFQHEKYIAQCIESVLSQEADFPFEILIGEDDSTDGTRGICKKYAEEHPDRIRLFLRKSEDPKRKKNWSFEPFGIIWKCARRVSMHL
jgi:glycosyltransferase involved in cell wall biosynthesis